MADHDDDKPSFLDAWALVLVQIAALAAICVGVALVYLPAALIVAGAAVIFAIERGGT